MENQTGTTEEAIEVPLWDRMYAKAEAEPEQQENSEPSTHETAEHDAVAESTDEVDSESNADEVSDEDSGAEEADIDEMFITEDGEKVSLKALLDAHKGKKAAQADYTKKTTAAAEEMKQAVAIKAENEAEKASIGPKLQILRDIDSGISELIMGDFANIDWADVRDSDPSRYLALKEAKEARENAVKDLIVKRDKLIAEQSAEEAAKLHEKLGWSDVAIRDADVKLISEGVKAAEVPDHVFSQVTNAALMALIYDGIKHRKLQESKPGIVRQVKMAPKAASKPVKQAAAKEPMSLADRMYSNRKS